MHEFYQAFTASSLILVTAVTVNATDQPLSVYDIQSSTLDGDVSTYDGDVIDCLGGICVGKFAGTRPRLILQDPNGPGRWSAIEVKDWMFNSVTQEGGLYDQVEIGDWVSLMNVLVEEQYGMTLLQYQATYSPGFTIISRNNPLPSPIIVSVADIPAPIPHPGDEWYVENHDAEPYESMQLVVRNVTVAADALGKAVDNYSMETPGGDACWAADYMNADVEPSGYHPFVHVGQHFCAVAGTFEQYTRLRDGWDYYQLITMTTSDLAICGDGDSDTDVDLSDLPRLQECITGPHCDGTPNGCNPPAWYVLPMTLPVKHCLMMDMDYDGDVDLTDFAGFQRLFRGE